MSALLEIRGLKKYFGLKRHLFQRRTRFVHALDGIDLDLMEGETLGVVGESGSGKSTLGRTIVRLEEPSAGSIRYLGRDVSALRGADAQAFRARIQMVFQDPYASLNPRLSVGHALAEPMLVHRKVAGRRAARQAVGALLGQVGLRPEMASSYPFAFSGGQRQRIGIARALALEPKILICDEAVSALDVSVQSQILNLFNQLKKALGLTYLFITHDLSVVRYVSDRVMVMYLGQVVELAPRDAFFARRLHPYTRALISAAPLVSTAPREARIILQGEIPNAIDPPSGCRFHTRCPNVMDACRRVEPQLREIEAGHHVRCHLYAAGQ
ncbi:MAG: ATP-binding cassette domain-containing protein [Betaproteobacteria bacterium]|nr:ATP-binding cassette domain-containing protein [Betaproteobacteria bacterium]